MTFNPATCRSIVIGGHGGSCCGISHIYSFPRFNPKGPGSANCITNADEAERRIRYLISKYWTDSSRRLSEDKNRLYEAVLQNSQRAEWEPVLLKIGFELVTKFKNTNSGNQVFVYHYAMGPDNKHGAYKSPYKPSKKSDIPNPFVPVPDVSIPY